MAIFVRTLQPTRRCGLCILLLCMALGTLFLY